MPEYTYGIILLIFAGLSAASLISGCLRNRSRKKKQLRLRIKAGSEGEKTTERYLEQIRGRKKIVMNVFIPKLSSGGTTEIDIIMVHEKGIIVIENKNYSGFIYGKKDEIYWHHVHSDGFHKHFYNPVMQNQNHVKYLKRLLRKELKADLPVLSVVTFNDRGKLNYKNNRSDDVLVTNSRYVKRKLQRKLRRMPVILAKSQINSIYELLQRQSHVTRKIKKDHEREVKYYQSHR